MVELDDSERREQSRGGLLRSLAPEFAPKCGSSPPVAGTSHYSEAEEKAPAKALGSL
jgi:hypothetical protein